MTVALPAPIRAAAVTTVDPAPDPAAGGATGPLRVAEVRELLRARWQASYDLQLVRRRGRLYLQVMWAYLEQQSFPLDTEAYEARLAELLEVLNTLGVAEQVRGWLRTTRERPRLGKAMSLVLEPAAGGRTSEFLI
jgi:hypothetical protein